MSERDGSRAMSGAALVVAQTGVIFLDAFRELNARKMFWISMAIAALVVSVFGVLGINAKGVTVLWFTLEVPLFNTGLMSVGTFYKMLFASVGIELWLGWASTILALVSSASLIPDFVGSGQIESMVARPIGRVRLFLTKYVAGLLFVFLQALVFTLAAVVLIGLRSGEWMWTLLAAVPIVTLFFSYLFCVSALVGVWTRSTLAALAAALAVWGCVLAVGVADNIVIGQTFSAERQANLMRADVQATALQVTRLEQDGATPERMADLRAGLERREREVAAKEKSLETLKFWGRVSATARTILPKTGETKDLIARLAISDEEMARFMDAADQDPRGGGGPFGDRATLRHVENVNKGRSVWWIVGTSLLFQGMVLGAACYVFARRDF